MAPAMRDRAADDFKLATWNCRGGLHTKWPKLASLSASIFVVQECARPERLSDQGVPLDHERCIWASCANAPNGSKGMAIIPAPGVEMRLPEAWPSILERWAHAAHRLDIIIPVEVLSPIRLNLLAVWAFDYRRPLGNAAPEGALLLALDELNDWIAAADTVVLGDFNHSVIWDKPNGVNNFAVIAERLNRLGLQSAYHAARNETFGSESEPTHYWRDVKESGPAYHIDYIFGPSGRVTRDKFWKGEFKNWCGPGLSDHLPLTLELAS